MDSQDESKIKEEQTKEELNEEEQLEKELEELEEMVEKEIEYAETIEYTSRGRAIIEVGIKNKEDFFSPYCVKGDEVIHPDVSKYIMDQAMNLSPNEDVQIDIYTKNSIATSTQEKMIASIRRNYADSVAEINTKLRRNAIISLIFFIVGAVFETLYILGSIFEWSMILNILSDLVAWVFLWSAVDTFFVVRTSEIINRKRYIKLIGATVIFYLKEN